MSALQTVTAALRRTVLLAMAAALLATSALSQTSGAADEAKVKAAFLLRFGQFVVWPRETLPQGDMPLVIGVAGADAIAAELAQQAAAGRASRGRPVVVRNVRAGDEPAAMHLLFVGAGEAARIAHYAAAIRGRPILLVTESPGALGQGSMINFVVSDRRVKFEIALDPAEKAGLALSSRLLAVAMRVLKGELDAVYQRVARTAPDRYR